MSRPVEPTAAPETTEMIGGYPVHPDARRLPDPTPEEYERLREDIRQNGLRVPIVITEDDQILDGRTRAKILDELGIDYMWARYKRYATCDEMEDPVATVLSLNAARRHLTGDQIIAIYLKANAAKLEAEKLAAKVTRQANLKKGAVRPEPESTTVKPSGKTAERIAKAVGKSKSAVERVQRVQKVAPEKLADVAAGKVSAAKVLKGARGSKKTTAGEAPATSMKYGTGRRSIESLMVQARTTRCYEVELWLQKLADAKRMGHPDFDQWLEEALDWHTRVSVVFSMLKSRTCPATKQIEEIIFSFPDDQQQDEAPGDPAVAEP